MDFFNIIAFKRVLFSKEAKHHGEIEGRQMIAEFFFEVMLF